MNYLEIVDVQGREILDSRGNPTVEAEITLADGTVARGCAPSGACLLYTSDAADEEDRGDLGGSRSS